MTVMYPYSNSNAKITNFRYYDWLILGRSPKGIKRGDREAMYVVMEDYHVTVEVDGKEHTIVVPKGMTTDLTSVPRALRSIVGRVGPHLEASIVHDFLFIAWQGQDRMPTKDDWNFTNKVYYAALKAAGLSRMKIWGFKMAMKFSWGVFKGRDKNLFAPEIQ